MIDIVTWNSFSYTAAGWYPIFTARVKDNDCDMIVKGGRSLSILIASEARNGKTRWSAAIQSMFEHENGFCGFNVVFCMVQTGVRPFSTTRQ